jgi:hypothetical protein
VILRDGMLPSSFKTSLGSFGHHTPAEGAEVKLRALVSKIKQLSNEQAVKTLISEYETENVIKFDSEDLLSIAPPPSFESAKHMLEMEIVAEEQAERIRTLRKKLDDCEELIQFGETDYGEMKRVVKDQDGTIISLRDKLRALEGTRRLKPSTAESIVGLIKLHTQNMRPEEIKESGWDAKLVEVQEMAGRSDRGDKKTSVQLEQLTDDFENFQCM